MECLVPPSHKPGRRLSWLSPAGMVIELDVPSDAAPGHKLQFSVPRDMHESDDPILSAPRGAASTAYQVVVPPQWQPGQLVSTVIDGQRLMLSVPDSAEPGMTIEVQPPLPQRKAVAAQANATGSAAETEDAPPPAEFEGTLLLRTRLAFERKVVRVHSRGVGQYSLSYATPKGAAESETRLPGWLMSSTSHFRWLPWMAVEAVKVRSDHRYEFEASVREARGDLSSGWGAEETFKIRKLTFRCDTKQDFDDWINLLLSRRNSIQLHPPLTGTRPPNAE